MSWHKNMRVVFLTCHQKRVFTAVKEPMFLILSFSLTYLDRSASALIGRWDLHLTFHLGWFGNFRDFLPLFPLAPPSWPSSTSSFLFFYICSSVVSLKIPLTEISLPFTGPGDVSQLKWWEAKLCVFFFSNFYTAGDSWGVHELLRRGECIHWHWCVFHRHDANRLEALNVWPGNREP